MAEKNPELAVQSGAVDTHCHLFLMEVEPAVAVETAKASGVERLICIGVDVETSRRSLEIADSFEGVFATAGVHPHDAHGFDPAASARIEELLHDPRVVAVGECGLDWFRMLSPREDQIRVFRTHIALSNETGKPVVVHIRDAWTDAMRILDEGSAERVVIHCFSGDAALARECAARGYWTSFAGNVTYPKNEHLRAAAAAVPPDRLLVETDSPFLAPQKLRGRANAPQNVLLTLGALAEVRGTRVRDLVEATANNARKAFQGLR
ncbi:MAG: TatD family deoxyribonuclease [Actinobacteria bacterium]|nr:MAG: TatD family deoxyribonuclease [Actinomycetota bacterium]